MNRHHLAIAAPLSLFLCAGTLADVFPTTAPTAGGNTIPMGLPTVYHEVFVSTLFSTVTGGQPALITRISLAPLNNIRYRAGLTVRLGYTAAGPGGISPPPSSSGGGGAPNAIVPPGMTDFYVAPAFLQTFTGASDSNFQMVLDGGPFVYDPAQGNLLVELVVAAPNSSPQMSATNAPAEASRAYNNGATGATTAGALRMDFTFSAHNAASSGACCLGDGSCVSATLASCQAQGGLYRGDNVDCGSSPCAQPGACCKSDGTCASMLQAACVSNGGVWQGAGAGCGAVTCAQLGACCASDGSCVNTLALDCAALGASWKPTACGVQACNHVLIAPHATCTFPVICNSSSAATSVNSGIYLDLTAATSLTVKRLDFNSNATIGTALTVTVWMRDGSYVGFDGSTVGWTQLAVLNVQSNGTSQSNPPVHLDLPVPVAIAAGQTKGFCIVAGNGGLRYRTSDPAVNNGELALNSAVSRTPAFTGAATTRGLSGAVVYELGTTQPCYPNCDNSTTAPILNVQDFSCFLNKFAGGDTYANCDSSTAPPVLNVQDFSCFLNAFATGCS